MSIGQSPFEPAGDRADQPTTRVRERLARAAFVEFGRYGFDNTTVDQIAESAGLSRRTFFRYFQTKEDVIFPEHERLRGLVSAELERRTEEPALAAVCASIGLVLADYVEHRDVSLARFALTRSVVTLRDREVTSVHRYQRLFARYLREQEPDLDALTVEIMASAVVAAHNSVLRDWLLAGATSDPTADLIAGLDTVQAMFARQIPDPPPTGVGVAVFSLDASVPDVIAALQGLGTGTQPATLSPVPAEPVPANPVGPQRVRPRPANQR